MASVAKVLEQASAGFGTSGLRGLVTELTDRVCFAATLGFLDHIRKTHKIAGGQRVLFALDLRPSSTAIARATCAAISQAGFAPVFCGAIPTPALALAALDERAPAIMITGSHIPFDRNGIKFFAPDGEISKEDEAPILYCETQMPDALFDDESLCSPSELPPISSSAETLYFNRYADAFPHLLDGWRVGLYEHSAVGRDLNAHLLKHLGAELIRLGRSDEFVPIDTEAVRDEDRKAAREWCAEHELDALISTDGDGDRPLLADENGNFFRGDILGILTARFCKAATVVTPVSSNTALERSGWFAQCHRTKIGSPHVISAMMEAASAASIKAAKAVVGYEANGGFLTMNIVRMEHALLAPLPTRDALLPVLATIALARLDDVPLSKLAGILPSRFTASDRLENRPSQASLEFLKGLGSDSDQQKKLLLDLGAVTEVDTTDGLRMTTSLDEIIHLRPSGNAPEFRIYIEAGSETRAAKVLEEVRNRLARALPEV